MLTLVSNAGAILLTFDGVDPTADAQAATDNPNSSSGFVTIRDGEIDDVFTVPGFFNGIQVTIVRADPVTQQVGTFDFIDNTLLSQQGKIGTDGQDQFGTVSLDPFHDASPIPWIFSFSEKIRSFSALFADFGGDGDSIYLKAMSEQFGQGDLVVDSFSPVALPRTTPSRDWTETRRGIIDDSPGEDGGFSSVIVYAGNAFSGVFDETAFINTSTYLDRIFFAKGPDTIPPFIDNPETLGDDELVVPEPASIALIALGGLALIRRRK